LTISISKSGVAPQDPWNVSEKYKHNVIATKIYQHVRALNLLPPTWRLTKMYSLKHWFHPTAHHISEDSIHSYYHRNPKW